MYGPSNGSACLPCHVTPRSKLPCFQHCHCHCDCHAQSVLSLRINNGTGSWRPCGLPSNTRQTSRRACAAYWRQSSDKGPRREYISVMKKLLLAARVTIPPALPKVWMDNPAPTYPPSFSHVSRSSHLMRSRGARLAEAT